MTGRERRLLRMLCMTAGGGGGGGDKPWDEMTWDDVIVATKNGKYKNFEIGAMKELDLGSEGIVHMQIVGIDADDLADGSGKSPLTFISHELLKTSHRMNPENSGNAEGTGTIGGWGKCEMRTYVKDTIKPLIPATVRSGIKEVTKYTRIYTASPVAAANDVATTEDVWIPSRHEIFDGTTQYYETKGPRYSEIFSSNDSRNKSKVGETSTSYWWLRSASNSGNFSGVNNNGSSGNNNANNSYGVALGFCL
jgi:hypothetical protein